jgi:hypothetical protein
MASKIMSTGLVPDSELEDTDVYGNVPLLSYVDDDSEDADEPDVALGAAAKDDEDDEAPPLIEPTTREVVVQPGDEVDDDPSAFAALTDYDGGGVSPGEAQRLIDYMRPLTEQEEALAQNPMFNDLTFVDDAASVDDMLKHARGGSKAMTKFMDDQIYGDAMSDEEQAERYDSEGFVPGTLPTITNQALFNPRSAQYEIVSLVDEPNVKRITNQSLVNERAAKYTVISGLSRTLVDEHAAWLEEQDRKAGIALRPRSFYLNVSKLWTKDQLKKASLPTSLKGDFSDTLGSFVGAAQELLVTTSDRRLTDTTMGWGWNPLSAVKSVAKRGYSLTKSAVTTPLKYGYKYGKKGVKLAQKGIEAGLSAAQRAALAPIKAVIHQFTNKIVNRRAAYYAKQAGVSTPTPDMRNRAKNWAKQAVRKNLPGPGRVIASLMGNDGPGLYKVDLSFSGNDMMGSGIGDLWRLIGGGVTGVVGMLNGLLKTLFGIKDGKPAPIDQPDDGTAEGTDPNAADPYADPGAGAPYADPGAGAPAGYGDPGAGYPDEGYPEDGAYGWGKNVTSQIRQTITLEQINQLPTRQRTQVQQALRQGRLRLV